MDAKDKRIAELERLFQAALEKIAEFEAAIAILKKNSQNSSKPPSSDIIKPPKPRKDKDRRRKIGAQKGHKAQQRQPFNDDQIDQTIELKLECCPKCKGTLTVTEKAPKIFQQIELAGRNIIVRQLSS